MDQSDKVLIKPDNPSTDTSGKYNLATLLSMAIAGITVAITLVTAFTMFKVYDTRLVAEFQDRVISESEELSQSINNKFQTINQQLNLFALDNSIRVTLMLDVDYQLQERMQAHYEKQKGWINFIVKNNGDILNAIGGDHYRDLIDYFIQENINNGQLFRTDDGKYYVGYTTSINSREKYLGKAGTLYQLRPSEFINFRNNQQGARLLYSFENPNLYDVQTGARVERISNDSYPKSLLGIQTINTENGNGFLVQLKDYPKLYFFMPSTELESARLDGITVAILLSVAGALLATIIAVWLSYKISRPLNMLVSASNKIAGGESDANLLPRSSLIHELHEFSHALIRIVQTLKNDEEKIRQQANYDPLSGLPNRNLFLDRFVGAIKRAQRNNTRIALMFIDLDQFKHINDTLGHAAGDQLLQQASLRLADTIRSSDTVARLGGDEFTVLMPDINELHHVEDVVANILESLSAPYHLEENEAHVSASIGITVYPDDGTEVGQLLRNADSAMYRAKEKGRNNAQFFTIEMNQHAERRRTLEVALRQAIDNNELELHFQPIYRASNKQVIGAEALLRWNLGGTQSISPAEFIPLAEDTGLILPIGEWILKNACKTAQQWNLQHHQPIRIAVNLSSRQFQRVDIPHLVRQSLNESGLDANLLTLEITESLLLSDNDKTLNTLHTLRDMNVEIAIDDFGTGYSSLSYLKRFPVTTLKIDRSFINDLPEDQEDAALVEAILSMSQSLNLKLVAEGVETHEQYQFLKDRNCAMVQGFFLSKPLSEKDFEDYLDSLPPAISSIK